MQIFTEYYRGAFPSLSTGDTKLTERAMPLPPGFYSLGGDGL